MAVAGRLGRYVRMATLVIWHGYLLGGTGSNIYSNELVDAWTLAGHDVVLMCQESQPAVQPAISEVVHVCDGIEVSREIVRESDPRRPGRCTMVRAQIGDLLPVFLVDRYPGFARVERFIDADPKDIAHWVDANAEAMRWVLTQWSVDGALINHVVMGPPAVGPVLQEHGVPYAVKVHGSELEYCIAADVLEGTAARSGFDTSAGEGRFHAPGRAGLNAAASVLVGSDHIARRTVELLGEECVSGRMRVAPPGVDIEKFAPLTVSQSEGIGKLVAAVGTYDCSGGRPTTADSQLRAAVKSFSGDWRTLSAALTELSASYDDRMVEQQATGALETLPPSAPIIAFIGKLIRQKGVHLAIAALPLVFERHPEARFVIAGFGRLREGLGALALALEIGRWDVVEAFAEHGGELDGGGGAEVEWLAPFVGAIQADDVLRNRYELAARGLTSRITNIGLVGHDVLRTLWPLSTVSLVPSVAAEAFGMVAAEAASTGAIPLVARHSGLADVAAAFESDTSAELGKLLSFPLGERAVFELADRISAILDLNVRQLDELSDAVRNTVVSRWSWPAVAEDAVDAMCAPVS